MKYSYTNEKGKLVRGSAAMLHLIYTVCGGPIKFIKHFAPLVNKSAKKGVRRVPKIISFFRKAS